MARAVQLLLRVLRRVDSFWIYVVVALWFLGELSISNAPIGYRHDWNIPFIREAMQRMWTGTDGFTYWNQDQFGGPPFYPTIAPFFAVLSFLATIGLQPWLVVRIVIFATLVIAGMGADRLARACGADRYGGLLTGLAFMSTAFVFTEISKGVLQDPLSYALMAWSLYAFARSRRDTEYTRPIFDSAAIIAGLMWAIGSFQVQYIVINAIDFAIIALATRRIVALAISGMIFMMVDSYYLIPYVSALSTITGTLSAMSPVKEIYSLSPPTGAALRLTGCDCRFPEQALEARGILKIWLFSGFAFFAATLLSGILSRDRLQYTFLAAFVVGLILTAGTSVLGPAYPWLVQHIPSAYAFRESFKFAAVPALFGALLFGRLPQTFAKFVPRLSTVFADVAILLVVLNGLPFFSSGLSTQLNRVAIPASAFEAFNFEDNAPATARVGFVPNLVPVQPIGSPFTGIDPFISWAPRPSFGNYVPSTFSKLLSSALYHRRVDEFRTLARLTNVEYFDVRYWLTPFFANASAAKDTDLDRGVYTTQNAVKTLIASGAVRVAHWPTEDIYRLRGAANSSVVSDNRLLYTVGDFEALPILTSDDRTLAFAAQTADPAIAAKLIAASRELVYVDDQNFDLEASLLPRRYQTEMGLRATAINANESWGNAADWNSWWWFNHDMIEPPERVAIAGSQNHDTLTTEFEGYPDEKVRVFAKVFSNLRAGKLLVSINGRQRAIITNSNRRATYVWFDLRNTLPIHGRVSVQIKNIEGENAVAKVIAVPESVLASVNAQAIGIERSHPIASVLTRSADAATIIVGKPARYRVTAIAPSGFLSAGKMAVSIGGRRLNLSWKRGQEGSSGALQLPSGQISFRYAGAPDTNMYAIVIEPQLELGDVRVSETGAIVPEVQLAVGASWTYRMGTNYEKSWTIDDPTALHFVANGYENGWQFSRDGIVRIELAGARLGKFGREVSVTSVIALLLALLLFRVRARLRAPSGITAFSSSASRLGDGAESGEHLS